MDRFENLRAFVAVVETGSFTAAADRLDVAKSAVSRRVSELEDHLGVQLMRRTTRRLNLTDTGRAYQERATRILADLDEADAAVLQRHGELRGTLKVALPLSFGVHHMCKPIAEFQRRHPRVTFDLDLNDRRVDLLEEGADLAVRIGHLEDSSLIARRILESRTVVCASQSYLDAHGTPRTPAELADHECLVYGNIANPTRWVCHDRDGGEHSVEVHAAMTASSGDFLCAAAAQGLGIVIQPTFIAGEAISRGELVPVLGEFRWPVTPAYALYPPTRHLSIRVREFIDYLVEYFSGTPAWDKDCPGH